MIQRASRSRGFTLLEVMTVVVIIAVFTAAALPSFFERMRDRRANEAAQEAAMFYRSAKARAIGRGSAQLVHYDTAGHKQGQLVLYEAIQALQGSVGASAQNGNSINSGNCGPLPQAYSSCLTTAWTVGPAVDNPPLQPGPARQVAFWPTNNADYMQLLTTSAPVTTGGTVVITPDVCFTPGGRTYTRTSAAVPFTPLTQILSLTVQRTTDLANTNPIGLPRQILVPPSGEARLFL